MPNLIKIITAAGGVAEFNIENRVGNISGVVPIIEREGSARQDTRLAQLILGLTQASDDLAVFWDRLTSRVKRNAEVVSVVMGDNFLVQLDQLLDSDLPEIDGIQVQPKTLVERLKLVFGIERRLLVLKPIVSSWLIRALNNLNAQNFWPTEAVFIDSIDDLFSLDLPRFKIPKTAAEREGINELVYAISHKVRSYFKKYVEFARAQDLPHSFKRRLFLFQGINSNLEALKELSDYELNKIDSELGLFLNDPPVEIHIDIDISKREGSSWNLSFDGALIYGGSAPPVNLLTGSISGVLFFR